MYLLKTGSMDEAWKNQFDRPKRGKENGYRNMASLGLDIFDSKKFFKCLETADFT